MTCPARPIDITFPRSSHSRHRSRGQGLDLVIGTCASGGEHPSREALGPPAHAFNDDKSARPKSSDPSGMERHHSSVLFSYCSHSERRLRGIVNCYVRQTLRLALALMVAVTPALAQAIAEPGASLAGKLSSPSLRPSGIPMHQC